jgi:hypothetical protein
MLDPQRCSAGKQRERDENMPIERKIFVMIFSVVLSGVQGTGVEGDPDNENDYSIASRHPSVGPELHQTEQGINKAGNKRCRALMVELAWTRLRYQLDSVLSQ